MTTLPSFVQLMGSLGLDHVVAKQDQPTHSSRSTSPRPGKLHHVRSKSTQCFRETSITRPRVVRYSPYLSAVSVTRRGSLSSSSSPELDRTQSRSSSTSTSPSSPRLSGRSNDSSSIDVYGSVTDLSANTPISSYVRRKTPCGSPTSPAFPHESQYDSDMASRDIVTVPILPTLIHSAPSSANSYHTSFSDSELLPPETNGGSILTSNRSPDISRGSRLTSGVRISSPPHAVSSRRYPRSRSVAPSV